MSRHHVGHLVRDDSRQLVVVFHELEQARKDADFSARHAKRVDLLGLDHGKLPFERIARNVQIDLPLQRLDLYRLGDAGAYPPHLLELGPTADEPSAIEYLTVCPSADLELLLIA